MLRVTVSSNSEGAKRYYGEGLSRNDYYVKNSEIVGNWGGKGASMLNLSGQVKKLEFEALCDNKNPISGDRLTVRDKDGRRVGYDFTFSVPKSVSISALVNNDTKIVNLFQESLRDTMNEAEKDMLVKVRKNNKKNYRISGNFVYAEFIHFTSRPVDGYPDPHLHAHCFVMNCTYDNSEHRWKAGEFVELKRNAPYYETLFNKILSDKLELSGYKITRTGKDFELQGIDRSTIDKFSRRTMEINQLADDLGIETDKLKSTLGAKTRHFKNKHVDERELQQIWQERLSDKEKETLKSLYVKANEHQHSPTLESKPSYSNDNIIDFVLKKNFERKSVLEEKQILTESLRESIGKSTGFRSLQNDLYLKIRSGELIEGQSKSNLISTSKLITSPEIVSEEKLITNYVIKFKDKYTPFDSNYIPNSDFLSDEQLNIVTQTMKSTDGLTYIKGKAGTGKTTTLKELVNSIENTKNSDGEKYKVFTFAPSAKASRGVLRDEGFSNAETVERFLIDRNLQEQTQNHVILVDEAGLLSSRQMQKIFNIANDFNSRIILVGDTSQHAPVERGDALRILENSKNIEPLKLDNIRRQQGLYKEAVKDFSEGKIQEGVQKLENMGAIKEVSDTERYKLLAKEYVQAVQDKKSALVVSPTHAEGQKTTELIRQNLKEIGTLNQTERNFKVYQNLNLTVAEKIRPESYKTGMLIQINQNISGIRRGEKLEIIETENGLALENLAKSILPIPYDKANKFDVYTPKDIALSIGDKIQITKNGFTEDLKRLDNGNIYQIQGFSNKNDIVLNNGWKLPENWGNLRYGYVTTSHSSQGQTVDRVIIAQSTESFSASNQKQAYVSISRGKESVSIYTDNKEELVKAMSRSGERLTTSDIKLKITAPEAKEISQKNPILAKYGINSSQKNQDKGLEKDLDL